MKRKKQVRGRLVALIRLAYFFAAMAIEVLYL